MQEPIVLTDATLENALSADKPVLLLFANGDGLRGDFKTAFTKAAADNPNIVIARIDPAQNPHAAARFDVGDKPTMIAVYGGEELTRRVRPWGTDVLLALELLTNTVRERNPLPDGEEVKEEEDMTQATVYPTKPVTVTDATFEQEVLNSDLPVLIDFWAPWCGPCRMVAPSLEKLAGEFTGQIKIAKVNVDENPGLSQAFRIMSIPNLMVVKSRRIVFNQPGALPETALRDLIKQAIALQIPEETPAPQGQPAQ